MKQQVSRLRWTLGTLWGLALAFLLCRHFLLLPDGTYFRNHEDHSFLIRLVEFRDCLTQGYPSPQWCTNFRAGLGSPYFSYYQPGIFYAASVLPAGIGPVHQFGLTLIVIASVGYTALMCLVGRRFGLAAGMLAGTLFLTSPYAATDLYIRGDLSEFPAMMLLPALLLFLDSSLAAENRWGWLGLAICGAVLVVMHPCIALFGYGFSLVLVGLFAIWTRDWRSALYSAGALGLGAGMASSYWMPVLGEWSLVSAEGAFSGHYHYSNHFLALRDLFGFSVTQTVIPVKVGLLATAVLVTGAVVAVVRWSHLTSPQRRLAVVAFVLAVGCLLLMNRASAPVWDVLPLLHRVQFPWRLFSVLGVAIALAGGMAISAFGPKARLAAVTVLVVAATVQMVRNSTVATVACALPRDAAQIRDSYFAPDLCDEWLPKGAKPGAIDPKRRQPVPGPGTTVRAYRMAQGRLACEVQTVSPSHVVLPHYYFPAGWTAELDGRPVALKGTESGLMRIVLPAGAKGVLTVRFGMTPVRKMGLAVSLASAIITAVWACYRGFRRDPTANVSS